MVTVNRYLVNVMSFNWLMEHILCRFPALLLLLLILRAAPKISDLVGVDVSWIHRNSKFLLYIVV